MAQVISEWEVRAAASSGFLMVPEGALVTPLAREVARDLGIKLGSRPRVERRKFVFGNWKMNLSLDAAVWLLQSLAGAPELRSCRAGIGVFPSYPYLVLAKALLEGSCIGLGAQDLHQEKEGAFTGEVSGSMLESLCQYVLVGHSERRRYRDETSDLVWKKAKVALAHGLTAVVCVGESARDREGNRTSVVLREQLAGVSAAVASGEAQRLIVAYEPIWAIGTGRRAGRSEIELAHGQIRGLLRSALGDVGDEIPILYGGSVQPDSCAELAASVSIDGFLVGGASLDEDSFVGIAMAFRETNG